jgi:hypothetical protein
MGEHLSPRPCRPVSLEPQQGFDPQHALTCGVTEQEGVKKVPTLTDPGNKAGIVSYPAGDHPLVLLFANTYSNASRSNVTLQVSRDGGESWPPELSQVIFRGAAGYVDVAAVEGGAVVAFENNTCASISVAFVPLAAHGGKQQYKCVNSTCVPAAEGVDGVECERDCLAPPATYKCVGGQCEPAAGGLSTRVECAAMCVPLR